MLPCFQSSGRLPSSSDLRNRMSSGGVSASATSLSTRGCHRSGPGDLLGFSFINLFLMISSVMVMSSSGVSSCMDCRMGVSSWFSLVKTLQKKEFSVSAFSLFVDAILPFPISRSLILDVVFILEWTYFQNAFGFDFRSWAMLCLKHALSRRIRPLS